MTESIGKTLTEKRVQKGLSVEELAGLTRMNARFIKAAEEDQFGDLPGSVFTIGLLRSCAKELGLDGDEIVSYYMALEVKHHDNTPEFISMPLHRKQSAFPKIMILAFLILLLLYNLTQLANTPSSIDTEGEIAGSAIEELAIVPSEIIPDVSSDPSATAEVEETGTEVVDKTADESIKASEALQPDAPTENAVEQPEKTERAEEETKTPEAGTTDEAALLQDTSRAHYLTLVAEEDSWVKVVVDEKITREIILREGKQITWWANENYALSIGNAAATKIFLDGVPVPIKQPTSNVIKNLKLPLKVVTTPTVEE